ncbi:15233_t:CDS:2 [Gigaspora rosea]|nr:15233_t:CDS:2 [Gigaspora rosea]
MGSVDAANGHKTVKSSINFYAIFLLGELIDTFQNRKISPLERYYYPQYPFTSWMYGSEGCEHFFGLACQIISDFSFNDLIALTPKIACMYKAYSSGSPKLEKEKTTGVDYISHYSDSNIAKNLEVLQNWLSDDKIRLAIHYAYKQATALAKDVLGMMMNTQIHGLITILEDEEESLEVENEIKQPANLQEVNSLQETKKIDVDVDTGVLNGMLKVSELVNQRRRHKAYTSQRIKRRVAGFFTSAPNNRYSSLVSYLSSNESARSGIPRQNR